MTVPRRRWCAPVKGHGYGVRVTSAEHFEALRPGDRPLRVVRSIAAALTCVVVAASGHHAAGGALPPRAVLAVFAGAAVVAGLLSARRMTPSQLLGLLVLCQVGVHLTTSPGDMAMGTTMIVGHVVATVVSALALARGERFVWELARRLGLRVLPVLRAIAIMAPRRPPAAVIAPHSRRDVRLAHSRWLRGPPVGLV